MSLRVELESLLAKKTVANYKKATKIILNNDLYEYAGYLLDYVNELLKTRKSWQLICQIFDVLGMLNYTPATSLARQICEEDLDKDMITSCATKAYIRLTRENLYDVSTAVKVLKKTKSHSVRHGALWSLGQDKVIPNTDDQKILIKLCEGLGSNRDTKRSDLRQGLAAACAGWNGDHVDSFLSECMTSDYVPLKYAAEKALKKEYPNNW